MEFVIVLFSIGVALWLYIFLPADMAKARNRSTVIWVLISICFTPLTAIFGLLVLGQGKPELGQH